MAYFAPNSTVKLINVDITNSLQYVFTSAAAQQSFFNSRAIMTLSENSYTSHDGMIRVELSPEQIKNATYLMWINPTQENQYFFAKITGYKWINSAPTTEITYVVDWFQTYQFQFRIYNCQMEREQLSATDWIKALTNPFTPDVLELQTPETLTSGKATEPIYGKVAAEQQARSGYFHYPDTAGTTHQYLLLVMSLGWLDDLSTEDSAAWANAVSGSGVTFVSPTLLDSFPVVISFGYWKLSDVTASNKWKTLFDQITIFGVTSEIIGLYNVSESVINGLTGTVAPSPITITPFRAYEHPKLARAPFSYLRVSSPSGVSKEYYYEDFASLRSGEQTCQLDPVTNVNGNPVEAIFPLHYGRTSDTSDDHDMAQRIEWADMPQVGYNIDAYLTYLSSAYNSAIAANSASAATRRNTTLSENFGVAAAADAYKQLSVPNVLKTKVQDFVRKNILDFPFGWSDTYKDMWNTGGGGNPYNTQSGSQMSNMRIMEANLMLSANNATAEQQAAQQDAAVLAEASGGRALAPSVLDYSKSAYIADEYHPGGNTGYLPYQIGFGTPTWTITRVTLEDHLADQYGDYLCRFGCASNRFGAPYVYNYGHNSAGPQPTWLNIDGLMASYAKTRNITVVAPNSLAEQYITAIFQGGCLFVRGDNPTPPAEGDK